MDVDLLQFVHKHTPVIFPVHAQGLAVEPGCRPAQCVQEHASIAPIVAVIALIDVLANIIQLSQDGLVHRNTYKFA